MQVVPNQYDIIPSWYTLIVDATFHLMKANENGAVKSKMTKMHHESFAKNDPCDSYTIYQSYTKS